LFVSARFAAMKENKTEAIFKQLQPQAKREKIVQEIKKKE